MRKSQSPVSVAVTLSTSELRAAREGRLVLSRRDRKEVIPVQWELGRSRLQPRAVFVLPTDSEGKTRFALKETKAAVQVSLVRAEQSRTNGQAEVTEAGRPVLRYNYQAVEPGDLVDRVSEGNRIYARARSDYIHPLHGLSGETLTRDWSVDHPHHRGIYWAWAEVDYGTNRGDLHALQKVFSRPTGKLQLRGGPVFAQVEAENEWRWEDREPIVREQVLMRVYRATAQGRMIDVVFQFQALKDGVTVARRGTDKYGGCLNVRLQTPQAQVISTNTSDQEPRRAWSDLSGTFPGAAQPSGLTILQHGRNPDYPGDWVQFPELSWCQPTFPAAGRRYPLSRTEPLVLRYRFWIHPGATPAKDIAEAQWDGYNSPAGEVPGLSDTAIKVP